MKMLSSKTARKRRRRITSLKVKRAINNTPILSLTDRDAMRRWYAKRDLRASDRAGSSYRVALHNHERQRQYRLPAPHFALRQADEMVYPQPAGLPGRESQDDAAVRRSPDPHAVPL